MSFLFYDVLSKIMCRSVSPRSEYTVPFIISLNPQTSTEKVVGDPEQDNVMISRLIQLRMFIDRVVEEAFSRSRLDVDEQFRHAAKDALITAVGSRKSKSAELLGELSD